MGVSDKLSNKIGLIVGGCVCVRVRACVEITQKKRMTQSKKTHIPDSPIAPLYAHACTHAPIIKHAPRTKFHDDSNKNRYTMALALAICSVLPSLGWRAPFRHSWDSMEHQSFDFGTASFPRWP